MMTMFCTSRFCSSMTSNCTWIPVIGLEIHAQIASASKLFSRVGTKYRMPPNTAVGVFEAAHPGTLPVLNKRCVLAAVKTAVALNSKLKDVSWFERKHYFYPDLPAGYQITQHEYPIAQGGCISFIVYDPVNHSSPSHYQSVDLIQIQLEEDSGKTIYDEKQNRVLVDLNRAGQPLMELVFSPQLHRGEEAAALVKELSLILLCLGTCSCQMDEGALRVDANISVHKAHQPLGTRTEVKNLNSLHSLVRAINFEVERQINILEAGGEVINETRSFDILTNQTVSMRDKEIHQDYRFMPEPNLLPLCLFHKSSGLVEEINEIQRTIPELPKETRERLMKDYGLTLQQAVILVNYRDLLSYYECAVNNSTCNYILICNLLLVNLLGALNKLKLSIMESPVTPSVLAHIAKLHSDNEILFSTCDRLIQLLCQGDNRSPKEIVAAMNWYKIEDREYLVKICEETLEENPNIVKKIKNGRKRSLNTLMGIVKKKTDGKLNMKDVNDFLVHKLGL